MSIELIAIVVVLVVNLVTFFFLNLKIHHVFYDLDAKIDRYTQESRDRDESNFTNLSLRIDTLYRDLFKKPA